MVLGLHEACTSQGVTFLVVPGLGSKAHTSWGRPTPSGCSQEGLGERGQATQCPLCPLSRRHTATDCTHGKPSRESILRTDCGTDTRPTLCLRKSTLSWEASTTQGLFLWKQEGTCQHPVLWSRLAEKYRDAHR